MIQEATEVDSIKENINGLLKQHFRPEFLNRLDEIVVFNRLTEKGVEHIIELQLKELKKRLAERKIRITITNKAKEELAQEGFDPAFGARPLKRLIQKKIYDVIALRLLKGEIKEHSQITVDYDERKKEFSVKE